MHTTTYTAVPPQGSQTIVVNANPGYYGGGYGYGQPYGYGQRPVTWGFFRTSPTHSIYGKIQPHRKTLGIVGGILLTISIIMLIGGISVITQRTTPRITDFDWDDHDDFWKKHDESTKYFFVGPLLIALSQLLLFTSVVMLICVCQASRASTYMPPPQTTTVPGAVPGQPVTAPQQPYASAQPYPSQSYPPPPGAGPGLGQPQPPYASSQPGTSDPPPPYNPSVPGEVPGIGFDNPSTSVPVDPNFAERMKRKEQESQN